MIHILINLIINNVFYWILYSTFRNTVSVYMRNISELYKLSYFVLATYMETIRPVAIEVRKCTPPHYRFKCKKIKYWLQSVWKRIIVWKLDSNTTDAEKTDQPKILRLPAGRRRTSRPAYCGWFGRVINHAYTFDIQQSGIRVTTVFSVG